MLSNIGRSRSIFCTLPYTKPNAKMSTVPKINFFAQANAHPRGAVAICSADNRDYTYGNLMSDSAKFAAQLKEITGLRTLDQARICSLISNSYEFVVCLLGTWAAGGIAVPMCVSHPPKELAYVLSNSQALLAFSSRELTGKLEEASRQCGRDVRHEVFERIDQIGTNEVSFSESFAESNGAVIIYTSGTTGAPKGCVHTHESLSAQSQSLIKAWQYSPSDRLLHVLPLHHIHGLVNALITPLYAGSTIEFAFPFNAKATWQRLCSNQITFFNAVPTIYSRLISNFESKSQEEKELARKASHHLRLAVSGSAALPHPIADGWEMISGTPLLERYGMSETGMILSNSLDVAQRVSGSVGKPLPYVDVRLVDQEGTVVGKDEEGEIQVSGKLLFKEYWNKAEATSKEHTKDGWFKTGDVAILNDETYFIRGRASVDIIKTGGEKVSALEVEREILSLNEVEECVVVGLEDKEWGQKVAAIVVLSSGASKFTRLDLRRALSDKLAAYKIPVTMKLVESIPRNQMGKVNKKTLVKEIFTR